MRHVHPNFSLLCPLIIIFAKVGMFLKLLSPMLSEKFNISLTRAMRPALTRPKLTVTFRGQLPAWTSVPRGQTPANFVFRLATKINLQAGRSGQSGGREKRGKKKVEPRLCPTTSFTDTSIGKNNGKKKIKLTTSLCENFPWNTSSAGKSRLSTK